MVYVHATYTGRRGINLLPEEFLKEERKPSKEGCS